jgi:integrase
VKAKITKASLDGLRAKAMAAGRTLYMWDTEIAGFGALSTKSGSASYFCEYRLGGRKAPNRRVSIGKHGLKTPEQARKLARAELGKVADGVDVAAVKKAKRQQLTGSAFRDLAERFIEAHGKDTRYWREKRARLLSDDLAPIAGKPIATVTRANISDVVDAVKRRSKAAALLLFADIRPIFAWALQREAIETNPMLGMRGPGLLKSRDRVLSDGEITAFWRVTERLKSVFSPLFQVLLLTGQRLREAAEMRWEELDFDKAAWIIPAERCKNGKAHYLDLSPQALCILSALHEERVAGCDFVFSATGKKPISGFSTFKEMFDPLMEAELGKPVLLWRIHDLRRTAASGMAGLGFPPHVVERVLNHVSGAQSGLVSVYQRHEYRAERKAAMLAWARHVEALLASDAPGNVVEFPRFAANGE